MVRGVDATGRTDFQPNGQAIVDIALLIRMKSLRVSAFGFLLLAAGAPSMSAEAVTYTYDAKVQLAKVARTCTVNNNVTIEYGHDKADNRQNVKISGS